jgi:hypothetical protein
MWACAACGPCQLKRCGTLACTRALGDLGNRKSEINHEPVRVFVPPCAQLVVVRLVDVIELV